MAFVKPVKGILLNQIILNVLIRRFFCGALKLSVHVKKKNGTFIYDEEPFDGRTVANIPS